MTRHRLAGSKAARSNQGDDDGTRVVLGSNLAKNRLSMRLSRQADAARFGRGAQSSAQSRAKTIDPKVENLVVMRDRAWRDPDSNRGHHDFQSWSRISLAAAKTLQFSGFPRPNPIGSMSAICGLFSPIWALERLPVPNRRRVLCVAGSG
jgi:hypothetical protein